jgi:hypothetical protein
LHLGPWRLPRGFARGEVDALTIDLDVGPRGARRNARSPRRQRRRLRPSRPRVGPEWADGGREARGGRARRLQEDESDHSRHERLAVACRSRGNTHRVRHSVPLADDSRPKPDQCFVSPELGS